MVDLDNAGVRDAVTRNPELTVGTATPVCIDEYQKAPMVLDAIKARLNAEGSVSGTAVITGSTRHDALPRTAQALTGRLHVMTLLPFSQGELEGTHENFLESFFDDPAGTVAAHPNSTTTRDQYVERVLRGGLPLAVNRSPAARARWFDDYVKQSIERDVVELARIRDRELLRTVLNRAAGQTAQVLNVTKLGSQSGSKRETVESYLRLLEDLFLVQRLDAWGTTLRVRTQKHPKLHVIDSGLAARLLRITAARLTLLDPSALTEFGNLLETFVVGELRKHATWMEPAPVTGHWRTFDDDEADLVVEHDDGRVVAFEVKADERVSGKELKGLKKLRDALGDRFVGGVAFSTGKRSYTYEPKIYVCPVDRLWRTV